MDIDNKIKITAISDFSDFDQKISELQRKIKSLRETGPNGSYAQLAQTFRSQGKEQEAQRIEQYQENINKQQRLQLSRDLQQQENLLIKNENAQKRVRDSIENTLKTQQNINNAKELEIKLAEKHLKITENINNINKAISAGGGQMGGGGGGNIPLGPVGPAGGGGGMLGMLANPKILAAIGSAIGLGGEAYRRIARYPETIAQREATIAGMTSESARLQAQGKGYEMSLFGPERARALQKASTAVGAEKFGDITKMAAGGIAGYIGGRTIGAGIGTWAGGVIGSIIPGVGTVAGAALGNFAGGHLGGMTGTAIGSLYDNRRRSMLLDPDAYQKEMGAVFSNTYQDQFAAERAKSYKKDLAAQFFEGQSDRFRRLQRKFGLSDEELFKGDRSLFSRAASKEGGRYGMEDIDRAMMGISAAGGPTKVAVGGAIEAAKLQRNLGVTNAPELMGRISGVTGMDEIRSKDEVIRMFAEGTRIGLDASEVKDFMQTAAETAYKTGGNLESITGLLSAGVEGTGLKTTRGIEASQNAMERLRQETGQRSGLTGQYKMAAMSSMGINDLGEMAYLSDLSIDQIKSDPRAMRMLKERGIDPDNFIKEMSRATTKRDKTVQGAEGWTTAKKKLEGLRPGTKEYEQAKKDEEKAGDIFAQSLSIEESLPKSGPERQAYIEMKRASLSGDTAGYEKAQKSYEEAKKKAETEAPGAVAKADRSKASDQEAMLLNLTNNIKALNTAFDENTGLTAQAKAAAQGLEHLAKILENIKDPDIKEKVQKALEEATSAGKEKDKPDSSKEVNTGNQGPVFGFN